MPSPPALPDAPALAPGSAPGFALAGARLRWARLGLLAAAILLATLLRFGVVLLYPLLPLLLGAYGFRPSGTSLVLAAVGAAATAVAALAEGALLGPNLILSVYFLAPVLAILALEPHDGAASPEGSRALVGAFLRALVAVQVVNNLLGAAQFVAFRHDDAFIGLYGRHGLQGHGLGVINGFLFLWAYARAREERSRRTAALAAFFAVSFVLAFFGMALIALLGALAVFHARWFWNPRRALGAALVLGLVTGTVYATRRSTFEYNVNIITTAWEAVREAEVDILPRKLRLYGNYLDVYGRDPVRLLFGTGPGTFNSRTSFLLNGDYSPGNVFEEALGASVAPLAARHAHPLWDRDLVALPFQDGTMNQPFSAVVALLAEYGLLFTLLVGAVAGRRLARVLGDLRLLAAAGSADARVLGDALRLQVLFLGALLLGENLLEFTEILVFLVGFKLIEAWAARAAAAAGLRPAFAPAPHPVLAAVLRRRAWRALVAGALVGGAAAGAWIRLGPRWYRASAAIVPLPSADASAPSAGGRALRALPRVEPAPAPDPDRIAATLRAPAATGEAIARLDLVRRYDVDHLEEAREELDERCRVEIDRRADVVTLSCEDRDPEVAQALVETLAASAERTLRRVRAEAGAGARRALVERHARAGADLEAADRRLRELEVGSALVDPGRQARSTLETVSALEARRLDLELELAARRGFASRREGGVLDLEARIGAIGGALARIDAGTTGSRTMPALAELPGLAETLQPAYVDSAQRRTIHALLSATVAQTDAEAARDTPAFRLLDAPARPSVPERPDAAVLLAIGVLGGLAGGVGFNLARSGRPRRPG